LSANGIIDLLFSAIVAVKKIVNTGSATAVAVAAAIGSTAALLSLVIISLLARLANSLVGDVAVMINNGLDSAVLGIALTCGIKGMRVVVVGFPRSRGERLRLPRGGRHVGIKAVSMVVVVMMIILTHDIEVTVVIDDKFALGLVVVVIVAHDIEVTVVIDDKLALRFLVMVIIAHDIEVTVVIDDNLTVLLGLDVMVGMVVANNIDGVAVMISHNFAVLGSTMIVIISMMLMRVVGRAFDLVSDNIAGVMINNGNNFTSRLSIVSMIRHLRSLANYVKRLLTSVRVSNDHRLANGLTVVVMVGSGVILANNFVSSNFTSLVINNGYNVTLLIVHMGVWFNMRVRVTVLLGALALALALASALVLLRLLGFLFVGTAAGVAITSVVSSLVMGLLLLTFILLVSGSVSISVSLKLGDGMSIVLVIIRGSV